MKEKLKKSFAYYKENGFKETLVKIYRYISFRIKIKLAHNKNGVYRLSKKEEQIICRKTKTIHIFMNIPYYDIGGGQRGAQLAKTFNKMGFKVNYIYLHDSSESQKHSVELPLAMHQKLNRIDINKYKEQITNRDIFIFEAPSKEFVPYLELAKRKKCKVVYENIDNWETTLGSGFFDRKIVNRFLKKADLLVGTSVPLVDQLNQYLKEIKIKKNVQYLANAVDSDLFDYRRKLDKPKDMVFNKKTLLYYGSLWGEWFDWDLLFSLAEDPDITINLIGDYEEIRDIVAKSPQNVVFLGSKKQSDLPNYLKYCDYAIIPFKPDEIGRFVSPLKVFEYISMNKKVLCTTLEDVCSYPNVFLSNDAKEWLDYMHHSLPLKNCDEFVSKNNWYDRCTKILNQLNDDQKRCEKEFYDNISIVILNYNNKDIIDRCIDSIKLYNKKYKCEIIVVDNLSTDGSYEILQEKYKDIKLYRNTKNGCSSGRNLGVAHASKDYIMFLDSDQWVLYQDWIDSYIEIFERYPDVGAIGWAAGWFNNQGYSYHVVDSFPYRYMPPVGLCRGDIGYIGTGGLMMKRQLFNELEGFDLYYDPTCYEDTDLSLKIRHVDKEIVYCPYLGIGHLPHQTTKSGSKAHERLIQKNGNYFVEKWKKIDATLLKYKK